MKILMQIFKDPWRSLKDFHQGKAKELVEASDPTRGEEILSENWGGDMQPVFQNSYPI